MTCKRIISLRRSVIDLSASIPDPFINLNELAVQWVAEKDWVYKIHFMSPQKSDGQNDLTTELVFEGLDTFATVLLNGKEILKSDNMFLSHRVDVTQLLKAGEENSLEIIFESALLKGRDIISKRANEHWFVARQTEDGRIPVRKAQCHWGWDWGPILVTAGPWKPIYLEQNDSSARIADFWVQASLKEDLSVYTGHIIVRVDGVLPANESVLVRLSLDGTALFEQDCDLASDGHGKVAFSLDGPRLWYPAGYGAQTRYKLEIARRSLRGEYGGQSKFIGVRRCELVQEQDDFGKSFYFRINNIDVFAGGSCWIPADSFLTTISKTRYYDWIKLLVEGNQSMIRIWGGGIYEDDAFFDACDELGVLVWHDFAFACGNYPAYSDFAESVEKEARDNLGRLRSHPSIVIWAGNNEDYQVQERYKLDYNYQDKDPESWLRSSFPARYLYEYLLPKIVSEEDPGAIYHPSSPWGDGKHTTDPTVGDIHQWNSTFCRPQSAKAFV
jgi:beta-mannosidase